MFKTEAGPPAEHHLVILDATGDTKQKWDPAVAAEVTAARATYDALKAKGYLAYRVTDAGGRGELVREFDPAHAEIILVPPVVGG